MELYLIRHGQSTSNRGDVPVLYPPLTDLGREQALRAGESLRERGIAALYCSPMRRNIETAAIVGHALGLTPRVFPELCEYGGMWPREVDGRIVQDRGMTREQVLAICPDAILSDGVTDKGWWPHAFPGDTDELADLARVGMRHMLDLWQARHLESDDAVAIITHGRSGSVLLSTLFGLPTDRGYARFGQNNCGISRVEITEERTRLVFLNRVDHLSPEMVT